LITPEFQVLYGNATCKPEATQQRGRSSRTKAQQVSPATNRHPKSQ